MQHISLYGPLADDLMTFDLDPQVLAEATAPAITATSLALFLAYAKDAGNWSGQPIVGGNGGGRRDERGNLTQLKKAGLITTHHDEGCTWIVFTEAGKALAAAHGVEVVA